MGIPLLRREARRWGRMSKCSAKMIRSVAGKKERRSSLRMRRHGPDGLAQTIWFITLSRCLTNISVSAAKRDPQNIYSEPLGFNTRQNSASKSSNQARYAVSSSHWLSQAQDFTRKYGGSVAIKSMLLSGRVLMYSRESAFTRVVLFKYTVFFIDQMGFFDSLISALCTQAVGLGVPVTSIMGTWLVSATNTHQPPISQQELPPYWRHRLK